MGYRFQKFTTFYPKFVNQLIENNPDIAGLSFDEMHDRFARTRFGWSDWFATHMRMLGNEAEDHFVNIKPLQVSWAREHGVRFSEKAWLRDIVVAQINVSNPDVVFLEDTYLFDKKFRRLLRESVNKGTVFMGWKASSVRDLSEFNDLDAILSSIPDMVRQFRERGAKSYHVRHGFEHSLLDEVPEPLPDKHEFVFVGSIGKSHTTRLRLVKVLMDKTPLEIWGMLDSRGFGLHVTRTILGKAKLMKPDRSGISDPLELLKVAKKYGSRINDPIFGLEMFNLLANSRVTFNNHIDCDESLASNMRLFEATGMASCLVTEESPGLKEVFQPGSEVVTYRSAEECVEKVEYLLSHESEREKIATAGQRRTLKDHTLRDRVMQIDQIIKEIL